MDNPEGSTSEKTITSLDKEMDEMLASMQPEPEFVISEEDSKKLEALDEMTDLF